MKTYAERITDEFNRWARAYDQAVGKPGAIIDESVTAFMCNAISMAVHRSSNEELKRHFSANAKREGEQCDGEARRCPRCGNEYKNTPLGAAVGGGLCCDCESELAEEATY